LDRVSGQFAKLFTGQKTSFGQVFKSLGEEALQSSIKSGLQQGIGALTKGKFQIGKPDGSSKQSALWVRNADGLAALSGAGGPSSPLGKPDGTALNPIYVIVENPAGGPGQQQSNPGSGALGSIIGAVVGVAAAVFGGRAGNTATEN